MKWGHTNQKVSFMMEDGSSNVHDKFHAFMFVTQRDRGIYFGTCV